MSLTNDDTGNDSAHATVTTYLITGASRGLGQAVAMEAAATAAASKESSIRLVLVARSVNGLEETKLAIQSILSTNVSITTRVMDLADMETLEKHWDGLLQDVLILEEDTTHHNITFVNNAGSLGHVGPCSSTPSLRDLRQTVDLNVTGSLWQSVRLIQHVKQNQPANRALLVANLTIVNVSSLVAISNDFVTMGIYSACKGARDKYHAIMANEEEGADNSTPCNIIIKTLSYAPGPLETAMTESLRHAAQMDKTVQQNFHKPLLDARDSAKKLIRLLQANSFSSGAHIDYYDLPDND
jgi:sepiapterin reductase